MNKRRRPIHSKVYRMVLGISLAALTLSSVVGIVSMMRIQGDSEAALLHQMEQNLYDLVISKARVAESELERYADYVQTFSDYLHELYDGHPILENSGPIQPARTENANVYAMQRVLSGRDVPLGDVREDLLLLVNMEHLWKPIMLQDRNSSILSIYYGTKDGLLIAYDKHSHLTAPRGGESEFYYDYFKSPWYRRAVRTNGLCFTDAYQDAFGRGMVITCVAPVYDEKNEFAGVVGMDILFPVLYRIIIGRGLKEEAEGAYAFLVDREGSLIEPSNGGETKIRNLYYDYTREIDYKIAGRILRGKTGVSLSESGIYYGYTTITSTGWKLCIRVPESLILAPVRSVNRNVIMTIALFVMAFIMILALVAKESERFSARLTGPIVALGKDVEKISDGDLDYRAAIHDNDEIGDLAAGFNNMAASLKEYIQTFAAVTAERERIKTELNVAAQIQADLLPCTFPPFPDRREFAIYATMIPAKEVGGDFYDFFFIDGNHLALVMADVSGKGMPAALFMVITRTLIKNRAQMGGTPSEILEAVNNQLCEESRTELFVTAWLGILEISTGKLAAANAGHEYPAIRRAGGSYELMRRAVNNPAVATLEGMRFYGSEFCLRPGDSLFLYTDGVVEATRAAEGVGYELYGRDRMINALDRHGSEPVEALIASMKREVDAFVGEAPQFDDITMLALQYYGGEEKTGAGEMPVDEQGE
ncbi:MAG: SpoIIE family protein phosphatase [Fretibacterium sp.]|nr:SpoIIE family protein phosphatase [Fretibacterium sp.]